MRNIADGRLIRLGVELSIMSLASVHSAKTGKGERGRPREVEVGGSST